MNDVKTLRPLLWCGLIGIVAACVPARSLRGPDASASAEAPDAEIAIMSPDAAAERGGATGQAGVGGSTAGSGGGGGGGHGDAGPGGVDGGRDAGAGGVAAGGAAGATSSGGAGGATAGPSCGNGVKEGNEQCDLGAGNTGAYGGCNANCTLAPSCGDGVVNGPEACDNGAAANTGAYGGCNANCTLAPHCGDGVVNGPEACDNGTAANAGAYNGCNANCTLAPFCGDGVVNGPETCDNGASNGSGVGQCNPICSGTVATKHVVVNSATVLPNFGGPSGADAVCQAGVGAGYKAFIADGVTRIATVTAFKGDGQVGWVLSKFTHYVDASNQTIWTTDESALLGVTNGAAGTLANPIAATDDGAGVWTGMSPSYVSGLNCVRWTSDLATDSGLATNPTFTDVGAGFPNNGAVSNCVSFPRRLICVEQ